MANCEHTELDATLKASLKEGKFFLCVIVWCKVCMADFEFTENIEKNIDDSQVLIEVRPRQNVFTAISTANN